MTLYYKDGYDETRSATFIAEEKFGFVRCRDDLLGREMSIHFLGLRTDGGRIPTLPELRSLAQTENPS